jgi:L-alanine-DL-glutamate epimerase-like enolase superfamily enzyme
VNALLAVKRRINIPIATGERAYTRYGFRELVERGAADILQPDVIHAGGFLETKKIAAMAEACYITIAPHNSAGAGMHGSVGSPGRVYAEFQDTGNIRRFFRALAARSLNSEVEAPFRVSVTAFWER